MRATWTVLAAIAIGLILLQNWDPVLSLVLFGSSTIALPLAVWLGLGLFAGIVTSVAIQLLNYRPVPSSRPSPQVPPRYREENREPRRTRPPNVSDWEVPPSPDWDPLPEDDGGWDIDEPPEAATVPQSDLRRNARKTRYNTTRRDRPSSSPNNSPKTEIQTSEGETRVQGSEGVYDANYRVIVPPEGEDNPNPSSNDDAENWEF